MPYIITTRKPCTYCTHCGYSHREGSPECLHAQGSTRAVATLDEARRAVQSIEDGIPIREDWQVGDDKHRLVTESGGTTRLPDGTVIEVTKAHGQEIVDALPEGVRRDLWARHPGVMPMDEILTAFNSR